MRVRYAACVVGLGASLLCCEDRGATQLEPGIEVFALAPEALQSVSAERGGLRVELKPGKGAGSVTVDADGKVARCAASPEARSAAHALLNVVVAEPLAREAATEATRGQVPVQVRVHDDAAGTEPFVLELFPDAGPTGATYAHKPASDLWFVPRGHLAGLLDQRCE